MKDLDLVIFDMDGLMLDTERRYADDIERVMRQLGVTVNMEALWESIVLQNSMKRGFSCISLPALTPAPPCGK